LALKAVKSGTKLFVEVPLHVKFYPREILHQRLFFGRFDKMAAKEEETPARYKQPSRKGKKAWRKNIDIREVEEGIQELRDELIEGYATLLISCGRLASADIWIVVS
jgi:hypothetical protein